MFVVYLLWITFVAGGLFVGIAAILFPQFEEAFQANPGLNGLIIAVLAALRPLERLTRQAQRLADSEVGGKAPLVYPMVAAAAVEGQLVDPRRFL